MQQRRLTRTEKKRSVWFGHFLVAPEASGSLGFQRDVVPWCPSLRAARRAHPFSSGTRPKQRAAGSAFHGGWTSEALVDPCQPPPACALTAPGSSPSSWARGGALGPAGLRGVVCLLPAPSSSLTSPSPPPPSLVRLCCSPSSPALTLSSARAVFWYNLKK